MKQRENGFYRWILGFFGILIVLYVMLLPTAHYTLGNVFFGQVPALYNVTFAEFFFERATRPIVGSVPPYANHQLSRTHFIQGDSVAALKDAYMELELYPEHLSTYYIIGLTLGYMDREEEAIDAFGQYLAYNPESWAARNDRAWLQFRIGDMDGALATIEPVSTLVGNPWVQNTYGTLLMNKGRLDEARVAFSNAQVVAEHMTEEAWGRAYPGNDPSIYGMGLEAMRQSIASNLAILNGTK